RNAPFLQCQQQERKDPNEGPCSLTFQGPRHRSMQSLVLEQCRRTRRSLNDLHLLDAYVDALELPVEALDRRRVLREELDDIPVGKLRSFHQDIAKDRARSFDQDLGWLVLE